MNGLASENKANLQYKIFSIVSVVLSLAISTMICGYYKLDRSSVKAFELPSNVASSEAVGYGIAYLDWISVENGVISAAGWGIHKGVSNERYANITFLLRSGSGKLYSVSTFNRIRSDITENINDGINYNRAGFESRGRIKNLPSGEYQTALLIINEDRSCLMINFNDTVRIGET